MYETISAHLHTLTLQKDMGHYDKDRRFMAASDLTQYISISLTSIAPSQQRAVCTGFLKQLEDSSLEVQGNAVRCLVNLVPLLEGSFLGEVVVKLSTLIVSGPEQLRDVYGACLRSLFPVLPASNGSIVTKSVLPVLVSALRNVLTPVTPTLDVVLDVINDTVQAFGIYNSESTSQLTRSLLDLARASTWKLTTRKRATACIGSLSSVVDDNQFKDIVTFVGSHREDPFIYVNTLASIVRSGSSNRLRPYFGTLFPELVALVGQYEGTYEDDRQDERVEAALFCLENLLSVTGGVWSGDRAVIDTLMQAVSGLIKFNPNFIESSDAMEADEADHDDGDYDGYYSDDEDSSWKVRRASVRFVSRIVSLTVPAESWVTPQPDAIDLPAMFKLTFSTVLISRAQREIEESVVVELLMAIRNCVAGNEDAVQRMLQQVLNCRRFKRINAQSDEVVTLSALVENGSHASANMDVDHTTSGSSGEVAMGAFVTEMASPVSTVDVKLAALSSIIESLASGASLPRDVHTLLSSLTAAITVDPSLVKEVDLGPFKHRVDEGSPLRKSAVHTLDVVVQRLALTDTSSYSESPEVILTTAMDGCLKALSIDLRSGGLELYPSAASAMDRLSRMNHTVVLGRAKQVLECIQQLVSSGAVTKPELGDNPTGTVMGQVLVVMGQAAAAQAKAEGYRVETVVNRDIKELVDLVRKCMGDKTPGSVASGIASFLTVTNSPLVTL